MSSRHLVFGSCGIAIAALFVPFSAVAEPLPTVTDIQQEIPAARLGGPITPSQPNRFEAKPNFAAPGLLVPLQRGATAIDNRGNLPAVIPFEWQSELSNGQRRSRSGVPVWNVNID